jgi:hyperosmotically inducible protein
VFISDGASKEAVPENLKKKMNVAKESAMNRHKGYFFAAMLSAAAVVSMVAVPAHAADVTRGVYVSAGADAASDAALQAAVQKKLNGKNFKSVTISVANSAVKLGGTVELYAYKEQADDKAHHVKGVTGVDNEIQVVGKVVSDAQLQQQVGKKVAYDRIGWPDNAFNDITVSVQDGVVTLGGNASVPWAAADAAAIARNTPGVKDVVDDIQVAPVSPMDDQTRMATYRRVYGFPALNKYAIDPAKPIRITVVNGVVTLSGVVDNKMDKDLAGIQANQVSGVFKVINNLQVAGQPAGQK